MNNQNKNSEKKNLAEVLATPWIVLPVAVLLVLCAALYAYPPFWQAGYAPADPAVFFTETDTGININKATLAELTALPGIGEVKAQAILDYREQNGDFHSLEELLEVPGIGPRTLEQISGLIRLEEA